MKKEYFIFVFLIFGFTCADQSCNLKDGKYKVVYDKQFSGYAESEFVIIDQTLIELKNNQKSEYKINWIAEDQFRLDPINKETDSLTSIQEELNSLGEPYYQITGCKAGDIMFEFYRNPHILINSGKLIRKD
ncbi:hypothetical protein OKW21_006726 [Catalinimonas alkaloidigena]|uniref:hypothetical protein n=1 Tax=Catalinimonas alkaloidigena TaxID=1075417 RepID=UPI002406D23E|nr:hypothetical protein [Catalinimonas alkaloidigena]MDF9795359.1 hypothetical protein [Catalinimonas alkaloidigena]MDF9801417.1 hypothetical protein [Catalinimonas alkaloidigena]